MHIKVWAYIFGIILILIGILGFVPEVVTDGKLLGIFAVNFEHNVIHILTGIIAILAGYYGWPKQFFIIFGIVYGLIAIAGFYIGNAPIMGMAHNYADAFLHAAVAALSLWLGLSYCKKCCGCTHDKGKHSSDDILNDTRDTRSHRMNDFRNDTRRDTKKDDIDRGVR